MVVTLSHNTTEQCIALSLHCPHYHTAFTHYNVETVRQISQDSFTPCYSAKCLIIIIAIIVIIIINDLCNNQFIIIITGLRHTLLLFQLEDSKTMNIINTNNTNNDIHVSSGFIIIIMIICVRVPRKSQHTTRTDLSNLSTSSLSTTPLSSSSSSSPSPSSSPLSSWCAEDFCHHHHHHVAIENHCDGNVEC